MNFFKFIGDLLEDQVFSVVTVAWVAMFWNQPTFLFISLAIIATLTILQKQSWTELIIYIYMGIFGALAEIIPAALGAWTYATPQLLTIPFWLPLVWGLAGICGHRLYFLFVEYKLIDEYNPKHKKRSD